MDRDDGAGRHADPIRDGPRARDHRLLLFAGARRRNRRLLACGAQRQRRRIRLHAVPGAGNARRGIRSAGLRAHRGTAGAEQRDPRACGVSCVTPTTPSLESLAARAKDGDREALEALVAAIRHDIYNLAVRMLWHPADAEDATQEILLRIVTKLATFRGDSAFRTWSFRVATNHLLNVRRSRAEREALTFERFGTDLETGLSDPPAGPADDPQQALLVEEVKLGCPTG
ncbi:MAG: RNA polymerase sigma factor, partial [Planctomycetes bacterium]|nr:RNA polymerase sigma factor [Planctomycetota bacterium]